MGWPAAEVCGALEISEGNQRVLLYRARTRVRAALERYDDAAFLASDEAAYITGQTLFVDGGLTHHPSFLIPWSSE